MRTDIALELLWLNKNVSEIGNVITDKDRLSRQKISKEKNFSVALLVNLAY